MNCLHDQFIFWYESDITFHNCKANENKVFRFQILILMKNISERKFHMDIT